MTPHRSQYNVSLSMQLIQTLLASVFGMKFRFPAFNVSSDDPKNAGLTGVLKV